jgi:hypothetical protein
MAEQPKVLVYPPLRISELEERARVAGDKFHTQKNRTLDTAQAVLHPTNVLSHHKGSLITGIVSFLLLGKIFTTVAKFAAPKLKIPGMWGLLQAGWMWNAFRLSYRLYKFVASK